MASKQAKAAKAPAVASRPAAEGTAVSFTIHDQEHTLEAAQGPDGWAITPADEDEARALDGISDEALNPPAAPEPVAGDVFAGNDEDAGEPGQEDQA